MKDDGPGRTAGGTTREEAAAWFARMRAPDAATDRSAFEAWLAASPLHRDAYNRIAEVFGLGKSLGGPSPRPPVVTPATPRARHGVWLASGLALVAATGTAAWMMTGRRAGPASSVVAGKAPERPAASAGVLALATPVGAIRTWRLSDGSRVTLDTDSLLKVSFTPDTRALRLIRGRVRFDVAHQPRPFMVAAGAGTVTAHGTLFDVGIRPARGVSVRLIRGAIDVALVRPTRSAIPLRERLVPGQQLVFDADALPVPHAVPAPPDDRWPDATLDCDRTPLATIVAEANRYSSTPILIPDPAIAGLAVSGDFRIDDPGKLARHLALLFDLTVTRDAAGRWTLTRG